MSLRISSSRKPTASLAAILAIGNPVALLARALTRLTRGFISMTIIRPVRGVDGELDVRAAGLDADLAEDRQRGVAHPLVFLVGQASAPGPR